MQDKLKEQKDLLEEATEDRMIICGQGNIHLPGSLVVKYQNELKQIQDNIDVLERLIRKDQRSCFLFILFFDVANLIKHTNNDGDGERNIKTDPEIFDAQAEYKQ